MSEKLTITEGLAELKLIKAKIESEIADMARYVARAEVSPDPLAGTGQNSAEYVKSREQAIADHSMRYMQIKAAIDIANWSTLLTIDSTTMPVAGWLIWRRELAPLMQVQHKTVRSAIDAARVYTERIAASMPTVDGKRPQLRTVVNVNEIDENAEVKRIADILGTLDARLSLLNATTVIEF